MPTTSRRKLYLFVTKIVFTITIFFVAGSQFLFRVQQWWTQSSDTAIIINREKIPYATYNAQYETIKRQLAQTQTQQDKTAQVNEAHAKAWEAILAPHVYKKATPHDLSNLGYANLFFGKTPHPVIQHAFVKNKQFDPNLVYQYIGVLATDDDFTHSFIKQGGSPELLKKLAQDTLQAQYNTLISHAYQYHAQPNSNQETREVEYICLPYSTIAKDEKIEEEVLQDYYKTHQPRYTTDESWTFHYTVLPIDPSAADEAHCLREMEYLKTELEKASDDLAFADKHADISATKKTYTSTEAQAVLHSAPAQGMVTSPEKTLAGTYQIHKVTQINPTIDITTVAKPIPCSEATQKALREQAEQLTQQYATHFQHTVTLTADEFSIPNLPNPTSIMQWVHQAKAGDTHIFRQNDSYIIVKLSQHTPKGPQPFDKVRSHIYTQCQRAQKAKKLMLQLSHPADMSLQTIADTHHTSVQVAQDVNTSNFTFGELGTSPEAVGTACALQQPGDRLIVTTDKGVLLIQLTNINTEANVTTPTPAEPNIFKALIEANKLKVQDHRHQHC